VNTKIIILGRKIGKCKFFYYRLGFEFQSVYFPLNMAGSRGEKTARSFNPVIFDKLNIKKELKIFLNQCCCILYRNAFKNFSIIELAGKFCEPTFPTRNRKYSGGSRA
jgi:hypothetical protein